MPDADRAPVLTGLRSRRALPQPGGTLPGRPAWLGRGLVVAGAGMFPWLLVLALTLPASPRAAHWPIAWVGLDGLEALGLLATGVALIRRRSWLCLAAAVTATLLVVDAWFDVLTSAPGSATAVAIAMAVCPELPTAVLCAVLAVRGLSWTSSESCEQPGQLELAGGDDS
jgi:hypothetical protein